MSEPRLEQEENEKEEGRRTFSKNERLIFEGNSTENLGLYWKTLWENNHWVRRRVTTNYIIDSSHVEYQVSLDVDTEKISHVLLKSEVFFDHYAPVPLALLKKELQLDLDFRDSNGKSCNILTSNEDSHFAHAYFLSFLQERGISLEESDKNILFEIIRSDDGSSKLESIRKLIDDSLDAGEKSRYHGLVRIINNHELMGILEQLAERYFLSAYIPLNGVLQVIKYRRQAEVRLSRWGELGMRPVTIDIPVLGVGTAQREHSRVVAPKGVEFVSGELVDEQKKQLDDTSQGDQLVVENEFRQDLYSLRKDSSRYIFYRSSLPKGEYFISLKVVPTLSEFFAPATVAALLAVLMSALGLVANFDTSNSNEGHVDPSATVAIFGLIPTLFGVYISQNEHKFTARLHTVPRAILLINVTCLLVCAVLVALNLDPVSVKIFLIPTLCVSTISFIYFLSAVIFSLHYRSSKNKTEKV